MWAMWCIPTIRQAEEILVDHSLGIPQDAILSVRCGGTRRQAPMETICNHPLKFPLGLGAAEEVTKRPDRRKDVI